MVSGRTLARPAILRTKFPLKPRRLAEIILEVSIPFDADIYSERWDGEERRSEKRIPIDCPVRVKVLYPLSSTGPSSRGRLLDISTKGLKLCVPASITPGAEVQVFWLGRFGTGRVRYCIPADGAFHVGVLLLEVFGKADLRTPPPAAS